MSGIYCQLGDYICYQAHLLREPGNSIEIFSRSDRELNSKRLTTSCKQWCLYSNMSSVRRALVGDGILPQLYGDYFISQYKDPYKIHQDSMVHVMIFEGYGPMKLLPSGKLT